LFIGNFLDDVSLFDRDKVVEGIFLGVCSITKSVYMAAKAIANTSSAGAWFGKVEDEARSLGPRWARHGWHSSSSSSTEILQDF
jgi:hypothetical protein